AYAIHPAHGADGDQVFAVTLPANTTPPSDPASVIQGSWVEPAQFEQIYNAAADTYARAIVHAVLAANPDLGETYCEKFPKARCIFNKANCKANLALDRKDFEDQQHAEKKAFEDQQKADKAAFDAASHTPAEK